MSIQPKNKVINYVMKQTIFFSIAWSIVFEGETDLQQHHDTEKKKTNRKQVNIIPICFFRRANGF